MGKYNTLEGNVANLITRMKNIKQYHNWDFAPILHLFYAYFIHRFGDPVEDATIN